MSLEVWTVGISVTIEAWSLNHDTEYPFHAFVQFLNWKSLVPDRLNDFKILFFGAWCQEVVACVELLHRIAQPRICPVTHYIALEAPFVAEKVLQKFPAFHSLDAVDSIV